MDMVEALFCSSFSADLQKWTMKSWNFRTGSRISVHSPQNSKGGRIHLSVGSGLVLEAKQGTNRIHVWPLNQYHFDSKSILLAPGRINAFTATEDHKFFAFTIEEKIYLYQSATGKFNFVSCHLQPVSVLKFSKDGCLLACGGDDGSVSLWFRSLILSPLITQSSESISPVHLFNHHRLPVTDLAFSSGVQRSRITSTSADRTAKIYDILTGTLLLTIIFESGIECLTIPGSNSCMYLGHKTGLISEISYADIPSFDRNNFYVDSRDVVKDGNSFCGHTKLVSCLCISLDGFYLISGSNDNTIRIWDTVSHMCLFVINENGPISCLVVAYVPSEVFQNSFKPNYSFRPFNNNKKTPIYLKTSTDAFPPISKHINSNSYNGDPAEISRLKNTNRALFVFAHRRLVRNITYS